MPPSADPAETLAALIAAEGPIGLDRFMGAANAHYYATRDPFGAAGDFITAPEVSQMFGELIGLSLADLWQRAGRPPVAWVELGPGRGTLAADALRAMAKAGLTPPVHLVETSPRLRAEQATRLPHATWHDGLDSLPKDRALLIVANEFFDALPIRQFVQTLGGWRERRVGHGPDGFHPVVGTAPMEADVPPELHGAEPGGVYEDAPAAVALARILGRRLAAQGGALIAIDYGHDGAHPGDTLQAVHAHAYADPFARPGTSDLTAHVDFGALAAALAAGGARPLGPVEQGQWLLSLGLAARSASLARAAPDRADELAAAHRRLSHPEEMGRLFKVLGAVGPGWPALAGFG
jgi:SAM-dependent MidA family methyltransferase